MHLVDCVKIELSEFNNFKPLTVAILSLSLRKSFRMPQKPNKKKTTPARKPIKTSKKRSGLWKISLFLGLVVILGYAGIAIWEGKIDTSFLDDDTPIESEEASPDSDSSIDEVTTTLKPNLESYDLYFTKAFDFSWPAYTVEEAVIERPYYTLRYSEEHEQAPLGLISTLCR